MVEFHLVEIFAMGKGNLYATKDRVRVPIRSDVPTFCFEVKVRSRLPPRSMRVHQL